MQELPQTHLVQNQLQDINIILSKFLNSQRVNLRRPLMSKPHQKQIKNNMIGNSVIEKPI